MWGVVTPEEAAAKIEEQRKEITGEPQNLEEQAISLVGRDIYEKLIKGYTEKQWGRDCKELPSFIIKRLPVRLTFDNNYFNALYQGIPVGGYTKMIANLLDGIEVRLNTDYLENKEELDALADKVVYTGPIDAYFDYKLGTLEYRSVRFETETLDKPNFQGNAVVNYTDCETPWTRIIEHKWFEFGKDENGNVCCSEDIECGMTTFKVVCMHIFPNSLPCFSDIVVLGQICFLVLETPEPSFNHDIGLKKNEKNLSINLRTV